MTVGRVYKQNHQLAVAVTILRLFFMIHAIHQTEIYDLQWVKILHRTWTAHKNWTGPVWLVPVRAFGSDCQSRKVVTRQFLEACHRIGPDSRTYKAGVQIEVRTHKNRLINFGKTSTLFPKKPCYWKIWYRWFDAPVSTRAPLRLRYLMNHRNT